MHRFFVPVEDISDQTIVIRSKEDVKHAVKALRIQTGEEIEVSDGQGNEFVCQVTDLDQGLVEARIIEKSTNQRESGVKVTLYQGLPKSDKLELIIQKVTELGATEIVPLALERCVVKLKDDKSTTKKLDRWNRIAYEAAKQSKRGVLPEVSKPMNLKQMLDQMNRHDLVIVPYEGEQAQGIKGVLRAQPAKSVGIVIGSEGGFEQEEVEKLIAAGAKSVTLGPRILRTETAGIIATGIVQYELGDLGGQVCNE